MGGGEPNPTGDALLSKIVGDGRAGSGVNVGADNPRATRPVKLGSVRPIMLRTPPDSRLVMRWET